MKYPAELVLCNYRAQTVAETNKAHTSSTFHTPLSPPPPPAADPTFNELSITILSCSNLSTNAGTLVKVAGKPEIAPTHY